MAEIEAELLECLRRPPEQLAAQGTASEDVRRCPLRSPFEAGVSKFSAMNCSSTAPTTIRSFPRGYPGEFWAERKDDFLRFTEEIYAQNKRNATVVVNVRRLHVRGAAPL